MATTNGAEYLLPCSASFQCFDRFSILDDSGDLEDPDGRVPFWPILTTLLDSTPVTTPVHLAEFLDTIAVTLRGSSGPAGDYDFLKSYISSSQPAFFTTYWPLIVQLALELPDHFPSGSLPVLGAKGASSTLSLSRRQTACLLVHQLLCTLQVPSWREDFFDLSIWYDSGQRHEGACSIYQRDDWHVTYTLVTAEANYMALDSPQTPLSPIDIVLVDNYETSPAQLGLPSGAAVVSANRYIGFGQSATHEEVHVGCSPASYPAVLVTPPLVNNQVLVVKGAEAMLNITGQRRSIVGIAQDESTLVNWRNRTMLFMDSLELDAESDENGLPDLIPENLSREVNKAAIAFSSGDYQVIYSPLWGCGAFGGDPYVKVALLWCAASAAHTSLRILCDREARDIASSLNRLVEAVRSRLATAQDLMGLLRSIPRDTTKVKTLDWMLERLVAT